LGDNTVSHDGYAGIMFAVAALGLDNDLKYIAEEIVEYGREHNWCYLDTHPNMKPLSLFWRNPKHWWELVKVLRSENPKEERKKYPVIYGMSHRRQPEDVTFYKIIAGEKPSFFGLLVFALSVVFSSTKPHGNTGGKLISLHKLYALRMVGFSHWLIDAAEEEFTKNLVDMYGVHFIKELQKIYYRDPNHPFHILGK